MNEEARSTLNVEGCDPNFLLLKEHTLRHQLIKSFLREVAQRRQKKEQPSSSFAFNTSTSLSTLAETEHNERQEHNTMLRPRKDELIQQDTLRECTCREMPKRSKARYLAMERMNDRWKHAESRLEAKTRGLRKIQAAEQLCSKATMRYRGWIPWLRHMRAAKLERIKAERYFQYCLTQTVWTYWISSVRRSRAAKIRSMKYKVARMLACSELMLERMAWKIWRQHQLCLTLASSRVWYCARHAFLTSCWNRWIKSWKFYTLRGHELDQRALRIRNRQTASMVIAAWKIAAHETKKAKSMAEERRNTWQRVQRWLVPHGEL